jgi:preprotein translocase subunit YajC
MTSSATASFAAVLGSTTAPAEQGGTIFGFDPLLIGMLAILAVMIFFMFRNSRKRKADAEKAKSSMVPGVEVMTNYGLFGMLLDVDDVANTAHIEIAPGTVVKVHRQTLAKVVEQPGDGEPRSVEEAMAIAEREQAERDAADLKGSDVIAAAEPTTPDPSTDAPKFGERIDGDDAAGDGTKKPSES